MGTITLTAIEAATLVRLASREHDRRKKRTAPAQGYSAAAWAMEIGGERQLLERLAVEAARELVG